jgi:hypothetical protein
MPQLHLYVSDGVAETLRSDAAAANLSLSRYLAKVVTEKAHPGWPEGYLEAVCGSCPDFHVPEDPPDPPVEPWDRARS